MSSNINYGGTFYEEIEVEQLTKFLLDCESVSKQEYLLIPSLIFDSDSISFKGFNIPISRGLDGGLFTLYTNPDNLSEHEDLSDERAHCYRFFVPKGYIKSLKQNVV
ncbi:MAG: hypothetical protein IJH39_12885 [Clostridia bacterium]|nr:hypothetical protein [Clostridia bacterium]MBQ3416204.1 hypothetical protein [Clostridia bacterium]